MATDRLTALITGGTSGIGRAAALKLTQLGIHVLVVGRNRDRGAAPTGRPAKKGEIAEGIVFLATDRSGFIHGAKLADDGGRTAI